RRSPVGKFKIDILPCAVFKTKLKIAREEKALVDIIAVRKYRVAAPIGKLKSDNLPLSIDSILPAGIERRLGGCRQHYGAIFYLGRSQVSFRRRENGLGQLLS